MWLMYVSWLFQVLFPVNSLRNLALDFVFTDFAYLVDVDFLPDKHLYEKSLRWISSSKHIKRVNILELISVTDDNLICIVSMLSYCYILRQTEIYLSGFCCTSLWDGWQCLAVRPNPEISWQQNWSIRTTEE